MRDLATSQTYRRYVLLVLLGVNLLNYLDRQIIYALFPLIKSDLQISDTALGFLGSFFMVIYMCAAPLFGWLGDRFSRPRNAAIGWGIQGLATISCGMATSYGALLAGRAGVGVGEASFGTVAPSLLADYFPQERRGRIMAVFFLAIPVGSAIGYIVGGLLGQHFGWQAAFLMVGIPELLLVIPLWRLLETRQEVEEISNRVRARHRYRDLLGNRSFVLNTLAMAAMTFALGGLAQWMPTFLYRVHGLDVARGNTLFGAITVLAGIFGTLTGGWLGDWFQQKSNKGYLTVSGWGFLLGAPATALAIASPSLPLTVAAMLVAEFFLFLNTGPLNTVILNVTPASQRAMAFAVNIFFIHALGDACSPTLLGWFSDLWGLRAALLVTPFAIAVASLFCFACRRSIDVDMAKVAE